MRAVGWSLDVNPDPDVLTEVVKPEKAPEEVVEEKADSPPVTKRRKPRYRTLAVMVQSMRGETVVVELKNDTELTGVLEEADNDMNLVMAGVRQVSFMMTGSLHHEMAYVQGRQIRYIHIPDKVDIVRTTQKYVSSLHGTRNLYARTVRPRTTPQQPETSYYGPQP